MAGVGEQLASGAWLGCRSQMSRCHWHPAAGPKRKLAATAAATPTGAARAGGGPLRPGSGAAHPPAAKRSKVSVKDRLKKKLGLR